MRGNSSTGTEDKNAEGGTQKAYAEAASLAGPSWADQDEVLRKMWNDNNAPEEIATKLGRSVAAIMTRAARLGLPRRSAPGRKRGYKRTDPPKRKMASAPRVRVHVPVEESDEAEKEAQARIKMRVCLMCLNKFQSLGAFNRICPSCKGSADYVKGSSIPDFSFKVMT